MKRSGVLHPRLAYEITRLGHMDLFIVADAGLPIPNTVTRIDLAYQQGEPPFTDILAHLFQETVVEGVTPAHELCSYPPDSTSGRILKHLKTIPPGSNITYVSHDELKAIVAEVKLVVRTGETTSYANAVLTCGVAF